MLATYAVSTWYESGQCHNNLLPCLQIGLYRVQNANFKSSLCKGGKCRQDCTVDGASPSDAQQRCNLQAYVMHSPMTVILRAITVESHDKAWLAI